MPTYRITAEHASGGSVDHPCTRGVYNDPANVLDETVEAESEDEAVLKGEEVLCGRVDEAEPCDCRHHLSPGSNRWWESVIVTAEPVGQ